MKTIEGLFGALFLGFGGAFLLGMLRESLQWIGLPPEVFGCYLGVFVLLVVVSENHRITWLKCAGALPMMLIGAYALGGTELIGQDLPGRLAKIAVWTFALLLPVLACGVEAYSRFTVQPKAGRLRPGFTHDILPPSKREA